MTDRSLARPAQRGVMKPLVPIQMVAEMDAMGVEESLEILKHSFAYRSSRKWLPILCERPKNIL